jgi:hypothetical protein
MTSSGMFVGSGTCSRTKMAKKRYPKMTPEEHAERDETHRLAQERIAYHEAKAREQEEQQEQPQPEQ